MPILVFSGVLGTKPRNKHIFDPSPPPCSPSMRKKNPMLICCITFFPFTQGNTKFLQKRMVPQLQDVGVTAPKWLGLLFLCKLPLKKRLKGLCSQSIFYCFSRTKYHPVFYVSVIFFRTHQQLKELVQNTYNVLSTQGKKAGFSMHLLN